ncbi:uncharacterized protein N7498_007357 [Penicillium cinerascens]|uniref:Uncharacterized protein n=1 Tax=Penicillium cinerascens TaxID=70096 RepID=A0A9W9JNN2_9EURO|nr:uncharacterized protein N7498_007357 [Penicillium cinerascens]KAJ5198240.1 hypothetical protein N7498_007357 [Penicillium cinerascens]
MPQTPPASRIPPEFLAIPKETSFPELPDTGFYRQRAELASHSQSELINVPHNQRGHPNPRLQSCLHHKPGSRSLDPISSSDTSSPRSPDSGKTPELTSRETARRVITPDGVVLGANLDRYSVPVVLASEPEEKGQQSDSEHVMSFMNYDRVGVGMTER